MAPPPRASARAPSEADDAQGGTRLYESLYATILRNGLPPALAEDLVGIFGFGIDFQRPVASDDRLELLFSPAEDANDRPDVLYASLVLGGETHRAYRFETPRTGAVAYFDEKGGSLRKFLLRKPIADGRITSPFGTRYHPILGYAKFHNGVDWANKAGTPILATGDGKVVSAGPRGGYGNRIEIQHANGYDTAYNHMFHFAKGIAPGQRVHQGQVIGYVGSTGLSTGPHVHYEVSINGHFVDPMKIRLPDGYGLDGPALAAFQRQVEQANSLRHHATLASSSGAL